MSYVLSALAPFRLVLIQRLGVTLVFCLGNNGSYCQVAEFLPVKWVWHINRLLNVKRHSFVKIVPIAPARLVLISLQWSRRELLHSVGICTLDNFWFPNGRLVESWIEPTTQTSHFQIGEQEERVCSKLIRNQQQGQVLISSPQRGDESCFKADPISAPWKAWVIHATFLQKQHFCWHRKLSKELH